jgi:alkylated DNA repair protein (DNA oxidative demethylase)
MEILNKDIYIFRNSLIKEEKDYLINLYNENIKLAVKPKLKNGYSMSVNMLCFGKHWNSIDYKYYDSRTEIDNELVRQYPNEINKIAEKFSKQCFPEHKPDWDILIMNSYDEKARLGIHQDNSETKETLNSGHPVVSFSLGARTWFIYGPTRQNKKAIELDSGDVILFGNQARMVYHGVDQIDSSVNPEKDLLGDIRLNFTLRKY